MNTVLWVNARTGDIRRQACGDRERGWGGRSFFAHHFRAEVDPGCDPLGRHNKLIVASGLLADTPVTTAGRVSVGGKSPLTGGIKEANVGGEAGVGLAACAVE